MTRTVAVVVFAVFGFSPLAADAAPFPLLGVTPGTQFRLVFVSSTTRNAADGALAPYDAFVHGLATAAGLDTYDGNGVTWLALGSAGGIDANDRLDNDGIAIYNMNGQLVSPGAIWSGSLSNPINYTENGSQLNTAVWTGTDPDGTVSGCLALGDPCGMSGFMESVVYGFSGNTNSQWVWANEAFDAFDQHSVYAFSSVLSYAESTAPVPEPSTLAMLSASVLAMTFWFRGRWAVLFHWMRRP